MHSHIEITGVVVVKEIYQSLCFRAHWVTCYSDMAIKASSWFNLYIPSMADRSSGSIGEAQKMPCRYQRAEYQQLMERGRNRILEMCDPDFSLSTNTMPVWTLREYCPAICGMIHHLRTLRRGNGSHRCPAEIFTGRLIETRSLHHMTSNAT